ncbi:hypothetical protein NPX13_g210 [Xylaria arbuscula]|uniref:Uncharacterized protein n=1 Tax=Xylaria arbuscula TaxID=114810 RepID=A0A9W8NNA9_9PEZI|nr:hypothetical protein NPX13_g210 [Xylaria arbuscula]
MAKRAQRANVYGADQVKVFSASIQILSNKNKGHRIISYPELANYFSDFMPFALTQHAEMLFIISFHCEASLRDFTRFYNGNTIPNRGVISIIQLEGAAAARESQLSTWDCRKACNEFNGFGALPSSRRIRP